MKLIIHGRGGGAQGTRRVRESSQGEKGVGQAVRGQAEWTRVKTSRMKGFFPPST